MSAQRRVRPSPTRRRQNWLDRLVERIQVKRAVIALVALALLADVLLALSLWVSSQPWTPAEPPPEATAEWPTPLPIVDPVASPTLAPTPGATDVPPPTPRPWPTAAPSPSPLPLGPDDFNLLLLGTDMRKGADRSWRTDTIIVVAVRPQLGRVAMLSIPRDLWVTIPTYGQNRINVADYWGERNWGAGGGAKLLDATLQQNLGISIQGYARVNFDGLIEIIDALGGITVTVERYFDEWIDDADGTPVFHLQLAPGRQHMDGRTALNYCRSRHGSSDMDRSRRQQQVLLAMREAALRPEVLPRLPALISALSGTVQTDVPLTRVPTLLKLALDLKPDAFVRKVFDPTMARDWVTPAGAQVLLPNHARIIEVWLEMTTE